MIHIEFAHADTEGLHKFRFAGKWFDPKSIISIADYNVGNWTYGVLKDLQSIARSVSKGKWPELYFPIGAKCL